MAASSIKYALYTVCVCCQEDRGPQAVTQTYLYSIRQRKTVCAFVYAVEPMSLRPQVKILLFLHLGLNVMQFFPHNK